MSRTNNGVIFSTLASNGAIGRHSWQLSKGYIGQLSPLRFDYPLPEYPQKIAGAYKFSREPVALWRCDSQDQRFKLFEVFITLGQINVKAILRFGVPVPKMAVESRPQIFGEANIV